MSGSTVSAVTLDKLEARAAALRGFLATITEARQSVPDIFDDGRLDAREAKIMADLKLTEARLTASATQGGGDGAA
jgi:hypothetical protein